MFTKKRIIISSILCVLIVLGISLTSFVNAKTAKEKIPSILSKEVSKKYDVSNNTFVRQVKEDPKDKIEVEVGDINNPESFSPKVKIKRWDDEVNFSVSLIDNEADKAVVTTDKDKIKWTKEKREVKFYELPTSADLPDGGYEFEITLKEKPATNKTEFNIETKGLDFFYQPELTPKEIKDGYSRPENIIGSYAVYYKDPPANVVGGKDYKSGKVGHIYRPRINDSAGNWTWGVLSIDEKAGTLTVEIPQEFLDKAVYPVTHAAGLTFGYTTAGASHTNNHTNSSGSLFTGAAGTINSISVYGNTWNSPGTGAALYLHSNLSLIVGMTSGPTVGSNTWSTMNLASTSISAVDYIVTVGNANGGWDIYFDSGTTNQGHYLNSWFLSWANPITFTGHDNNKYSVYATYTASNAAPTLPSLVLPSTGATNVSVTPTFKTVSTDAESDNLQYELKICTDSGMSANCQTFDQTSSQVGWSGQNVGTTSYSTGTTATYILQTGSSLAEGTTYYWKTRAKDPTGSNTWSSTQATAYSFTTTTPANLTQQHFRWRNDDGGEKDETGQQGATFTLGEDTTLVDLPKDTTARLRLEISNEGEKTSGSTQYRLEVSEPNPANCASATYERLSTDADWNVTASSYITEGEATYDILALGSVLPNEARAVGGTITYDSTDVIHTFKGSATFTPDSTLNQVKVLVVGGGGGGGTNVGGGGGAGGYLYDIAHSITPENEYSITVGVGGSSDNNGTNSVFDSLTAKGGGKGGQANGVGSSGGSGGGAGRGPVNGGVGTSGQGYRGGNTSLGGATGGAGGGGASEQGVDMVSGADATNGGDGLENSISGSALYYAGGGGGGQYGGGPGYGGLGGGGNGGVAGSAGVGGTPNTGGGGGGGSSGYGAGGAGGSGIVIVRYLAGGSTVPALTNENFTFVAGELRDTADQTGGITLTGAEFTEIEYSIKPTSSSTGGANYCFRLTNAGSTSNFTYTKYAQATVYSSNAAPTLPSLVLPSTGATNVSVTPTFKTVSTDAESDNLQYELKICTDSGMSANCQTFDQTSSQVGWSGQNVGTTSYSTGTTATYILQTGSSLAEGTTYYWKTRAKDPTGSNTWSSTQATAYSFTTLISNVAPTTPSLSLPADSATNQSVTPTFKTVATDTNSDNLQYELKICTNSGMSTGCQTFDQTSSQVGWSGQNVGTTSYSTGTTATYILQTGSSLAEGTTYYWKTRAKDPTGSNTWSSTQGSPFSFTVGSRPTTPSLSLPADSATNVSLTPSLKTVSTDTNADYLRYKIDFCTNAAMSIGCSTFDQTSSQVGWSGQNVGTTAYSTGTTATYIIQSNLSENTTYYWRSYAIDPAGTNRWSGTQGSPFSFTTLTNNSTPTNTSLGFTNPSSGNIAIANNSTEWNFKAVVTDADGYANLDTVKLQLADSTDSSAPYSDLEFTWTQSTDSFTETGGDSLTAATLSNPISSCASNSCTLSFKLKFLDTFLNKATNYSAQLITTDDSAASDTDNYSNIYQVQSPVAPTVTTSSPATSITSSSATVGGEVTSDGGAAVSTRGIVFATTATPTIGSGTTVTSGSGTGTFSANLVTLSAGTTYYARAYAINSVNTSYGSDVIFATAAADSLPVSDGLQAWFKADAMITLSDGDTVASWTDSSGNNKTATQNTGSLKPVYKTNIVNGLPVLRFEEKEMLIPNLDAGNTAGYTVFVVTQPLSYTSSANNMGIIASSTKALGMWVEKSSHKLWGRVIQSNSTQIGFDVAKVLDVNQFYIITQRADGATHCNQYVGSTLVSNPTYDGTVASSWANSISIGVQGGSERWNGDIAEVIIYNRGLNDTERLSVENYLNSKYFPPPNTDPVNTSLGFSNPQTSNFSIANNSTEWNFKAVVTDADGYANLDTVKLQLADSTDSSAPYSDLEFTWTQSTDSFTETGGDSLTAATLSNPISSCASNSCTLSFKLKFLDAFTTKKTNYSAQLITTDDSAASDTDSYSDIYQVYPNYISSSTLPVATANSFQRKTWFDGTRYWSAFNANSQIEFWYSTDQVIWNENTSARIATDTFDFSIEADSTNAFITYTDTNSIASREAGSYPGTSFNWGNSTSVYTGTGEDNLYKNSTITRDSNDNVWISATQKSGSGVGGTWDITATWNTGDINTRTTNALAVIDKNHDGTPFIISPVQHGVKCYDKDGNLQWTYTGITNGYDVRGIATGDLNGTGYNDSTVIASGYYNTANDGKIAILGSGGTALQLIKTSDFGGTAPTQVRGVAVDGTDIYATTNQGVTKFVKSGSTWSEDRTGWAKPIGGSYQITVADMGNGKRIYVAMADAAGQAVYAYQTNGTEDWHYHSNNQYQKIFAIGKSDSSKTGLQMAIPFQSGFAILDKDGNLSQNWTAAGNNVRVSATFYDNDGDGEDEIYFSDMGDDVFAIERTGTNTYSEKYHKVDLFNAGKYGGLTHFDINDDGDDEIIATSTDSHVYIYDKTLTTLIKDLNVAHGTTGGYWTSYQIEMKGIVFADTSGDNHEDLIVSGATGYADVFEASGFSSPINYNHLAVKSTSVNDISAWGTPSTLNTSTNENHYGTIIPRTSASVYDVWIDGTDIEGKNFNGSIWDTNPTSIAVGITGITNTLSAVSDSSGNLHLSYVDTNSKVSYREYTDSWQTAVILDDTAGGKETTISIDSVGGDGLYTFWLRDNDIYYRRACSNYTTWDNSATLETANTNASLTSSFSDFGSGKIFAQYTQGSSSPYTINWKSLTPTTCSISNTAPSSPYLPYVNNTNAQSGQQTPVYGLTDHTPAFSAVFDDADTSDTTSNYQIQVNTSADFSGTSMWDSGKTAQNSCNENSRCGDITYNGTALADGSTYYWRIKFWDNSDVEGSWSDTQQFSMNSNPVVSTVVINGNNSIDLTENSSIGISWVATITDADTYTDISSVTGKIYRSGVGSSCSLDNNNCYTDATCDMSNCSGNSCSALCSANIYFFAEPTDTGTTFVDQYYQAWVQATDSRSEIGSTISSSTTVDVNTLTGFSISSSLVYGEVFAGSDTGSSNTVTTVTNTGNSLINLEITGDYMCTNYPSCGGPNIEPYYQQYNLNTFNYGTGTTLTTSPQMVSIGVSKPSQTPSNSTKNLYWGIGIPLAKEPGNYQGATTVLVY